MRATPPARALAWLVDVLDRFWGPLAVGIIVVLEAAVFAPRGMMEWMVGAGIVGAGLLVGWIVGFTG